MKERLSCVIVYGIVCACISVFYNYYAKKHLLSHVEWNKIVILAL